MIPAEAFVGALQRHGFSFASGVPCSYLRDLQARLWCASSIDAAHAANEGDAVALCAGVALTARRALVFMQNSGLGNAVNPLTSLTFPFRIPLLLLVSRRGDPAELDEPQHRLMGSISGGLLDLLEIPWEPIPKEEARLEAALARAVHHMETQGRPFALVAGSRTFADGPAAWKVEAAARPDRPPVCEVAPERLPPPSRAEALAWIVEHTPPDRYVVVASTGYASRELCQHADRSNHFYMVGSMGCAGSLGLGLALARPDLEVVVVEGDGAVLMRLGSLPMVGATGAPNLTHVVLDNGAHESTGGQPTLSAGVHLAEIARAAGYGFAACGQSLDVLQRVLASPPTRGPRFAHLRIRPGTTSGLPRPKLQPEQVRARLERHLAALRPAEAP